MRGLHVEVQIVHQARHQRQLLGRANGAADANRVVGGGLFPGGDVFQRLGEVKLFERVEEHDLEAGPRKLEHFLGR